SDAIVLGGQRVDRFFPMLPGARELAELLLAGREVHERSGGGVELLAIGEFLAGVGVVLRLHRLTTLAKQRLRGGGVAVLRGHGRRERKKQATREDASRSFHAKNDYRRRSKGSAFDGTWDSSAGATGAGAFSGFASR